MRMNKFPSFLLLIALMAHETAHSQINKCVDPAGKAVYSQAPCPAGQTSFVIAKPAPATSPVEPADKSAAKPPPTPEEAFQQRQKERNEAEKKAAAEMAEAKQRQEGCEQARRLLAQYEMGGRITSTNANGERYFLQDDQIAQAKVRAGQAVNEWCK
jgi:hypothetical protein